MSQQAVMFQARDIRGDAAPKMGKDQHNSKLEALV